MAHVSLANQILINDHAQIIKITSLGQLNQHMIYAGKIALGTLYLFEDESSIVIKDIKLDEKFQNHQSIVIILSEFVVRLSLENSMKNIIIFPPSNFIIDFFKQGFIVGQSEHCYEPLGNYSSHVNLDYNGFLSLWQQYKENASAALITAMKSHKFFPTARIYAAKALNRSPDTLSDIEIIANVPLVKNRNAELEEASKGRLKIDVNFYKNTPMIIVGDALNKLKMRLLDNVVLEGESMALYTNAFTPYI